MTRRQAVAVLALTILACIVAAYTLTIFGGIS